MKKVIINLGFVSSLVFGIALAHAGNEGSENMQKSNTKKTDFYKTYERKGGSQVRVNSAKDDQQPGQILMQETSKPTTRDGALDPTGAAGQSATPSGS